VCLIERYRTPQNGNTPLHLAALDGRATVVEKLLAAGTDKDATNVVRRAGDERCR
jgi:ankyrin repeat protein